MRINHNIQALNAYRNLSQNQFNTSKSLEKLSSGLRINRAADDAAGLAISEKMRSQIRGLDMAERNAFDAISLIQTAEGALNETHSILQRMRELSVQAANDTLETQDRVAIQAEVDQLTKEIDRIAGTTQFNQKVLLRGDEGGRAFASVTSSQVAYKGATTNTWEGIVTAQPTSPASILMEFDLAMGNQADASGLDSKTFTINGLTYEIDYSNGSSVGINPSNIAINITDLEYANGTSDEGIATNNINNIMNKLVSAITANDPSITASIDTMAADPGTPTDGAYTKGLLRISSSINMSQEQANTFGTVEFDSTLSGVSLIDPITNTSIAGVTSKLIADENAISANSFNITFTDTPKVGDQLVIDNLTITFGNSAIGYSESSGTATATIDIRNKSVYDVLADIDSLLNDAMSDTTAGVPDAVPALNSHTVVGNSLVLSTAKTDKGTAFGSANGLEVRMLDNDFEATAGKDLTLGMQIGPNASERMDISVGVVDAAALGLAFNADDTPITTPGVNAVKGIDLSSSSAAAQVAISVIDNAITKVSAERSKLGAFQNRLEHTINNLKTTNENLTSSESRIRDVDMAMEMTTFTKNNILNQSAQAMLAQANQLPQGILQLLQ
jgi:flagellin